jgi:cytoskeletal protein RodZ
MTIEGLGKKFQEARVARNLTLDEAARMTKIRPTRLAEIEADDFSQFPSLAYAKGFLQIYGKFLDVEVGPYLEAFETSEHVTVDGYSYLQEEPAPAAVRTPVVRRRPSRPATPSRPSSGDRPSLMPLVIGIVVVVVGFWIGKLLVNLRRLAPQTPKTPTVVQTPAQSKTLAPGAYTATAPITTQSVVASSPPPPPPAATPVVAAPAPLAPSSTPAVAVVSPPPPRPSVGPSEPEVRRAEPVRAEDLNKAAEPAGPNRIAIRPLKKTYIKVVVDNEKTLPAFERWVSPSDGTLEFRGQRVAIRVLDREAIQIRKNGKSVADEDSDITIE